MTNVYVGNLPYDTVEDDLVDAFGRFGEVNRATLVFDRETGRPRGFGFVEMFEDDQAQEAIQTMHGATFNGRPLTVNEARPRGSGRGDYQRGPGTANAAQASTPSTDLEPEVVNHKMPEPVEIDTSQGYSRGYSNRLLSA